MAELLICVDDDDAPQNPRRGDVIGALDDGHAFGVQEMRNPRWRILRVRRARASSFADLLAPEQPQEPTQEHRAACHYRAFYLEIDAELPEDLLDFLADSTRERIRHDLTTKELRAMVRRRPSIQPPAGIG